jgi:hypothetical protein
MGEAKEVSELYDRVKEALKNEAGRIDGALIRKVGGDKDYFSYLADLEVNMF